MKAAVVGTGNIARQHLGALAEMPGVSVAAVCDLSPAAAEAAAERFGVPAWYSDHRVLLDKVRPDVVHVTTPPRAHVEVAMDALEAGAHVVVEKPAAPAYADVEALVARARRNGRNLVEDYNYLFNPPVRRLCQLVESGQVGAVVHVEVLLSVDLGRSSGLTDYVTHLASLVHAFVGPHRRVAVTRRNDRELRAMVEGEEASAAVCFSGDTRPDAFTVRVHGTRLRATAQLFEPALVVERDRPGLSRPLVPVVNGLSQSATVARAAVGGVVGKLSGGPGSYAGLWELVRATYRAFGAGAPPPVSLGQVLAVNRLVADLSGEENG